MSSGASPPSYVALDCWAAVSRSYRLHAPKASSFSCPSVYQPKKLENGQPAEEPEQDQADNEGGGGAVHAEEGQMKKHKRRRKAAGMGPGEQDPSSALARSAARHQEVRRGLLEALESFRRARDQGGVAQDQRGDDREEGSKGRGGRSRGPGDPEGESSEPHQEEEEEEHEVDFVALEAMKQTLYPKLQMLATGEELDLFDRVVRCPERDGHAGEEAEAEAMGCRFVLPAGASFLSSDVARMRPLVAEARRAGGFHLVVADPPWENASARRSGAYSMLPNRRLLGLPVRDLLAPGPGSLVALWLTNREKLRRFAEEELLPAWGLRLVATWHWLKVTDGGEPVTSLDSEHRRPYEPLLLARRMSQDDGGGAPAPQEEQHGVPRQPPPNLAIISTPGPHSRKPRVGALLQPYLGLEEGPAQPRRLELFARELEAGWMSWGNEPLKFQHRKYFECRAGPAQPVGAPGARLEDGPVRRK